MNKTADMMGRTWFRIILVALLYFGCGKAALLLAVEPGFASPVWPSAGVALAAVIWGGARLVLGVFAGSFLLNLWQSAGLPWTTSVPLAGAIATGAVLQALVGGWLCRRFVGQETTLAATGEVAAFMTWGGVVSCLVNASCGVCALLAVGSLPWSHARFNWFNWWVGDAIGVMIFTPLLLAFVAEPASFWRRRRVSLFVPLAATLALVVAMFLWAENVGRTRLAVAFNQRATSFDGLLEARLRVNTDVLRGIARGIELAGPMNPEAFRHLAAPFLESHPAIEALEWLPVVPHIERDAFLEAARRWHPAFDMSDVQNGRRVPVRDADLYVTGLFVEPVAGNDGVLGLNHWASPSRRAAMEAARDSGQPAMTAALDLVRVATPGLQVFLPVYGSELRKLDAPVVTDRRRALRGFVASVLVVDHLVPGGEQAAGLAIEIHDETEEARRMLLYRAGEPPASLGALIANHFQSEHRIHFATRHWRTRLAPGDESFFEEWAWQSWLVLMVGLMFACVLSCLLLVSTGRSLEVEREVDVKTAEARRAEAELRQLAATLEDRVRERTEALKRSEAAALGNLEDARMAERSAKDSEERFRSIVEAAPSAMIMVDASGRITLVNTRAEELFGYSRDELLEQTIESLVPARFRDAHPGRRAGFMLNPQTRAMGAGRDLFGLRKDGREVPIEIGLNPVQTAAGSAVLASIIDITERKLAEEFVLEKNRELESLLYVISHDLREPLRTIRNFTEVVEDEYCGGMDEDGRRLMERIRLAGGRLERLLRDLLDVSRARRLVSPQAVVCLREIVDEAVERLDARLKESQATINIAEDLPRALVDPTWVGEAVLNLLSNAIKYVQPGSAPEIDVSAYHSIEQGVRTVGLVVADRGPGVDEAQHERIFELFQRGVAREVEGTGAGLAIVREVALKHGGRAWVEDRDGGGSNFVITLGPKPDR